MHPWGTPPAPRTTWRTRERANTHRPCRLPPSAGTAGEWWVGSRPDHDDEVRRDDTHVDLVNPLSHPSTVVDIDTASRNPTSTRLNKRTVPLKSFPSSLLSLGPPPQLLTSPPLHFRHHRTFRYNDHNS
jgi:hypothetical protein